MRYSLPVKILTVAVASILVTGCGGSKSKSSPETLTKSNDFMSNGDCRFGGTYNHGGADTNKNDLLDDEEITNTAIECATSMDSFNGIVYRVKNGSEFQQLLWTSMDGTAKAVVAAPEHSEGHFSHYRLSPDKSKIAFMMQDAPSEPYRLWVRSLLDDSPMVDVSGDIVEGGDVYNFQWSHDGQYLAFRGDLDVDSLNDLYSVNSSGVGRVKLTQSLEGDEDVWSYSWSPTMNRIAYRADENTDGVNELFAVNVDGSNWTQVSGDMDHGLADLQNFRWSHDGMKIAYRADTFVNNKFELFTATSEGFLNTNLRPDMPDDHTTSYSFSWSPDDSRVAFLSGEQVGFGGHYSMYSAQPNGLNLINYTPDRESPQSVTSAKWSPDGTQLLALGDILTEGVKEAFTFSTDGMMAARINSELVEDGNVYFTEWSVDGQQVILKSDQTIEDQVNFYSATPMIQGSVQINHALPNFGDVFTLRQSANGKDIIYRADAIVDDRDDFYWKDLEVDSPPQLLFGAHETTSVSDYGWSDDGNYFAVILDSTVPDEFELWIFDVENESVTKVSEIEFGGAIPFSFEW